MLLNSRFSLQGKVISTKMDKTLVVLVETYRKHPKYGKRIKYSKKYFVHDEENKAKNGDIVTIVSTRQISKNKKFRLFSVDSKNLVVNIKE